MKKYELTLDTQVEFKIKGSVKKLPLSDVYNEEDHESIDDFYSVIESWIQTGRAKVVDNRSDEEITTDKIVKELLSVKKAKTIQEDNMDREIHKASRYGIHSKVGFPVATLMEAQELHQTLLRNFNIKKSQLGVSMDDGEILVTVTDCPVSTYNSICRFTTTKKATDTITNTVNKATSGVISTTDLALNSLAVPVTKSAISGTAKIAKSLIGFTAKLGGIAVAELSKGTKECIDEIKNDAYIAEAKGEVTEGIHAVKRAVNNRTGFIGGGVVLE